MRSKYTHITIITIIILIIIIIIIIIIWNCRLREKHFGKEYGAMKVIADL